MYVCLFQAVTLSYCARLEGFRYATNYEEAPTLDSRDGARGYILADADVLTIASRIDSRPRRAHHQSSRVGHLMKMATRFCRGLAALRRCLLRSRHRATGTTRIYRIAPFFSFCQQKFKALTIMKICHHRKSN